MNARVSMNRGMDLSCVYAFMDLWGLSRFTHSPIETSTLLGTYAKELKEKRMERSKLETTGSRKQKQNISFSP